MKGLSAEIKESLDTVIEGLELKIDSSEITSDKLKSTMEAKTVAFNTAKVIVNKWVKSRNPPNKETLKSYIEKIVNAGEKSIVVLRKGLKEKIDYSDVDESKHKTAILAKPAIITAIYEIEAGIFEFRHQLETGNYNTDDDEFEIGLAEKFANGEILDTSNYWKDWLNTNEEAIKICPHGTEGKIVELDGLKIQLPEVPKDKSKILFSELPKEQQYWRRQEPPSGLSKQTKDQWLDYIYEEFRRRVEGVWFMNNGEPVYLTGHMYFALNWGRMLDNGGYMRFRYAQLDMFYFAEACLRDMRSLGMCFVKSRRTGFTYMVIMIMLNLITMTKNQKLGMTSKSDKDAEEAFSKWSYAFLNLPFFFRPVVRGNQESKHRIEFAKPADQSKQGKKKGDLGMEKYLNSEIDYRPTKNDSYDSIKLNMYLGDEAGKWKKPNNYERHWTQISPTMDEGGVIVGKAFIGSTVGAMKEGGKPFKNLEESSRVEKRDEITERTPSGLYSFFLPAHKNYARFTDVYGVCHDEPFDDVISNEVGGMIPRVGSIKYIDATAAAKRREGDAQYNDYMRTMPMTKSDAYRDEMAQSDFNLVKIHEQVIFNEMLSRNPVFRGNFQMVKENDWSKGVKWIPKEDGKFRMTGLPPEEMRNKQVIYDNRIYPANGMFFRGGVDSYDIDETVDGRASSGSLHIKSMGNIQNPDVFPNFFYLEYIERPPYAEMFYKDVFMAAVFFGAPLLIENNKKRIIQWGNEKGLRGYIMTRPAEYTPESERGKRQQRLMQGIPSNSIDTIQGHAHGIERYIHYHVGVWSDVDEEMEEENGSTGFRESGETGNMFFERTLEDWGIFNIKDRTKHDATISSGYAIMACNVKYKQKTVSNNQKIKAENLVRFYKRNGSRYG